MTALVRFYDNIQIVLRTILLCETFVTEIIMECMNKLIILIAICVLWFWSFLLLPKTGEKVVYLYHFLALCGLVMIYFALVDPAGLCDTFSILNIYVFINESSLVIGQENLNLINHSSKEAFCVLITVYLFSICRSFFSVLSRFEYRKSSLTRLLQGYHCCDS